MNNITYIISYWGAVLISLYTLASWTNYPKHPIECIIATIIAITSLIVIAMMAIHYKKEREKGKK
jgi:FtsH-binding integral membrane protein